MTAPHTPSPMPSSLTLTHVLPSRAEDRFFLFALLSHAALWTIIPIIVSPNVPIDVIYLHQDRYELQWGYANNSSHPPLMAWIAYIIGVLFPHHHAPYIILSQISTTLMLFIMWTWTRRHETPTIACISTLLTQTILHHTILTPEFNHNVILLPLWALLIIAFHRCITKNTWVDWLLWGVAVAVAMLAKYTSALLVLSMLLFLALSPSKRHLLKEKALYLAIALALLLFFPHVLWLIEHDFPTLRYALARAYDGVTESFVQRHILSPLAFLAAQLMLIAPLLLLLPLAGSWRIPSKATFLSLWKEEQQERAFAYVIGCMPLAMAVSLSLVFGLQLRSAWAAPFFLFAGFIALTLFIQPNSIALTPRFKMAWGAVLLLTILAYSIIQLGKPVIAHTIKRTQFPGDDLAMTLHKEWYDRFQTSIPYVLGDLWVANNIGFYAPHHPRAVVPSHPIHPSLSAQEKQEIQRHGGVIIWMEDVSVPHRWVTPPYPADIILSLFPCISPQKTLTIESLSPFPLPPLIFHRVLILPQSHCPT
ncbi:MAG: glycosyltransferase family 39 protein [Alphaproteobacteria bacterium GM7ARS4]|nr:glycosyltransferase family 39 protein [Alphaproteobacteria bacterium GM7ARS4]